MATNPGEHDDPEGWKTYRRMVVETLEKLCTKMERMEAEIIALKIKVTVFSIVWGIVGSIGGTIATNFIMQAITHKP